MHRHLSPVLLAIALCAAGCAPSRAKVAAMRDEADPVKSAANLADLLEHLEDAKDPTDPDRHSAMLDVGADLAQRVAGLEQPGAKPGTSPGELAERMRGVLRRDLDRPLTPSDADLRGDGFDPAAARSAVSAWAAWKLGGWGGPDDAARLCAALGRDGTAGDARLQAAIAAALLRQRDLLAVDGALAVAAWDGSLRVHARLDAADDAGLRRQLDALDLAVLDLGRLAAAIADDAAAEALRAAAIRQADRLLATWLADGVPEAHRPGLPGLASALAAVAVAGPAALADRAAAAAAGGAPWAFARAAAERPDGGRAAALRCAALRTLAAAAPALDPALYLPGTDLAALRARLIAQTLAALPALPADERWPALPTLAALAPAQLAERLSTAWTDSARAADWAPEAWLAGLRLAAAHPDLAEPVRRRAAEAAARIIAVPAGPEDPGARWDLAAEIAAPWPGLRAQALAGAALAGPPADAARLERLVRIIAAAALAIPAAERAADPGWAAAIDALAACARHDDLEPLRPGLRFLLDHAPARLVEAMRTRAASGAAGQQEVALLVDDALGGGRLPPPMRDAALDWQLGVATAAGDDDLRLVAGASVLRHADAADPRRARIAAALPLLAAAGNR